MSKPLQGKLFVKFKSSIMGSEVVPPVNVKDGRSVLDDIQTESNRVMHADLKRDLADVT
jgi:hypothetical protein